MADLSHRITRARRAIGAFRAHLSSPKFQGTEYRCSACGRLLPTTLTGCKGCPDHPDSPPDGEDKDWISIADVHRYLDDIEAHLSLDMPELVDRG